MSLSTLEVNQYHYVVGYADGKVVGDAYKVPYGWAVVLHNNVEVVRKTLDEALESTDNYVKKHGAS